MRRVIVFDVIETLLDVRVLTPRFGQIFGDGAALHEWFGQMLQSAFAITVAGHYTDFGTVARAALDMTAERRGVALTDEARAEVLSGIRSLPPHPEVPDALRTLRDAGFRLAALTNSTRAVADAQLASAGLRDAFEQVLSVEAARRFKPAAAVYHMAARSLDVPAAQVRLVAAHSWDVGGAMRAGCAAAFVARPGHVLDPLFDRPDIVGKDLREVAQAIVETDASGPA